MAEQIIPISNINQGGISDTPVAGYENSMADLLGVNLHDNPSLHEVNQRLVRDDNEVIDEEISALFVGSDGLPYAFGKETGKVWQRTGEGVWELLGTVTPPEGDAGIVDAKEANGYIYYSMAKCFGRYKIGEDFSERDDDFGEFLADEEEEVFHPIVIQNDELNVADGRALHNVAFRKAPDNFVHNMFRLHKPHRISSLVPVGNEVWGGTFINNQSNQNVMFRWNTYSSLYEDAPPISEIGVNAFIPTSNNVFINAGVNGSLYAMTQTGKPEKLRQIPGNFTDTKRAYVKANAVANFNNLVLFGVSNISNNPCKMGIYSYGKRNLSYPEVLNFEWPISQRTVGGDYVMENISINAITVFGERILVAWSDYNDGNNVQHGIDILDLDNKLEYMELTTRVIQLNSAGLTKISAVLLNFFDMPEETTAEVAVRSYNGRDDWSDIEENVIRDATRNQFRFTRLVNEKAVQFRIRVGTQPNTENISPVLGSIELVVE